MTSRTVFKIAGSFGPGGSLVILMEKLVRRLFNDAYELGDPTQFHTVEEDQIKQCRQDFVNELFNYKGTFERKSTSLKQEQRDSAYKNLVEILERYKKKLIHLEKQRLTKERVFYLREENEVRYKAALKKMEIVEEDTIDNIKKMTKHILNPNPDILREYFGDAASNDEEQGIEERISLVRAQELLEAYKRMRVRAEEDHTGHNSTEGLLALDTRVKDRLFIEYGEDVEDTFASFRHYKLNSEITENDRKKYGRS